MAWSTTVDKFFGADLKYGAWTYGCFMAFWCVVSILKNSMNFGNWLFFLGAEIPLTVCFAYLLIKDSDSKLWIYAWANWYFTFFAFILGTI